MSQSISTSLSVPKEEVTNILGKAFAYVCNSSLAISNENHLFHMKNDTV